MASVTVPVRLCENCWRLPTTARSHEGEHIRELQWPKGLPWSAAAKGVEGKEGASFILESQRRQWESFCYQVCRSQRLLSRVGGSQAPLWLKSPTSPGPRCHLCLLVYKEEMSFPRLAASINSSWDNIFLCFVSGPPPHAIVLEALWP